jgi:DNA-binding transcriptional MerR regulator
MAETLTRFDGTLTSGDVCEIAGLPHTTLDTWVREGLLCPGNNSEGRGRHRTYSFMDALAATIGSRHRDIGIPARWVAAIVRKVSRMSPDDLDRALANGTTLVVPLPGTPDHGLLVEPPNKSLPEGLRLDEGVYYVLREIVRLRPSVNWTGRNRGLAARKS